MFCNINFYSDVNILYSADWHFNYLNYSMVGFLHFYSANGIENRIITATYCT